MTVKQFVLKQIMEDSTISMMESATILSNFIKRVQLDKNLVAVLDKPMDIITLTARNNIMAHLDDVMNDK